ncbi:MULTISPECIES: hypothetical protein [Streptosporangium]|uniref:Uncharacterized protein n=1 Tax=Streptosporangium brasiliense TaxID=47480 RepID=A0ABT9RKQ3_9ACTN|nr:hypothetical protein [Streptosporangium brasiliense]MDP9868900.1 hypothetical protein [Streptosporangium brasiliense]
MEAVDELGDGLARRTPSDKPEQRRQALIDSFATHRALWVAQLEAAVQCDRRASIIRRPALMRRWVAPAGR